MTYDEYFPIFVDHFRQCGNVKEKQDSFSCNCPVCGDTRNKFTITNMHDRFVMDCFNCIGDGGFDYLEALHKVGLKKKDLHPPKDNSQKKKLVETRYHVYRNLDGSIFGKKTIKKYDDSSKDVYWQLFQDGKYINGLHKNIAPVFRIDELLSSNSDKIYVLEGEKDTDSIFQMGLVGTTFPNGGGQTVWHQQYNEPFQDKDVVVLTDNDNTGKKYGEFVASHLIGIANSVKVVPSTSIYSDISEKSDITDIIDKVGMNEAKKLLLQAESNTLPEIATELTADDSIPHENDLDRFHKFSKYGATDTIDVEIIDDLLEKEYIRVMEGVPRVYINGYLKEDRNGTYVKSLIRQRIYRELQNINRINRIYNLLLAEDSIQIKLSDCNKQSKHWINFQNGYLDVETMELIPHSREEDSQYNCLNQIPHEWHVDFSVPDNSVTRKHILGMIPDTGDRLMFYQYIGYSMTTDTSLQKFLILAGKGNTGKSTLLTLTEHVFGHDGANTSSLKLQEIGDRFKTAVLLGKLMNICAELPSKNMDDISSIKIATGEDSCTGEYKGGAIFSFRSYARLLFSANRIPKNKDDRTNAYYRRLLIIYIKQKGEYIPNLEQGLRDDVDTFIFDCVWNYHTALVDKNFVISENCKRAVMDLYLATDTVFSFLHRKTIRNPFNRISKNYLYQKYVEYCNDASFYEVVTHVSSYTFYEVLRDYGYTEIKSNGYFYFEGIELADDDYIPPELDIDTI